MPGGKNARYKDVPVLLALACAATDSMERAAEVVELEAATREIVDVRHLLWLLSTVCEWTECVT